MTWWKPDPASPRYHLFFNRDELNSRAEEVSPHAYTENDILALYPSDPQGGGTWIGINDKGRSVALLNDYQGTRTSSPKRSRGLLVKDLLHDRELAFNEQELTHYNAFHLCIFEQSSQSTYHHWNGLSLTSTTIDPTLPFFLTSSSYQPEKIIPQRRATWQAIQAQSGNYFDQIKAFHTTLDDLSPATPVMLRDDAHTRSHISIQVTNNTVECSYQKSKLPQLAWEAPRRFSLITA